MESLDGNKSCLNQNNFLQNLGCGSTNKQDKPTRYIEHNYASTHSSPIKKPAYKRNVSIISSNCKNRISYGLDVAVKVVTYIGLLASIPVLGLIFSSMPGGAFEAARFGISTSIATLPASTCSLLSKILTPCLITICICIAVAILLYLAKYSIDRWC